MSFRSPLKSRDWGHGSVLTIKRRKDNHDNLASEQRNEQNQKPPVPEKFALSSELRPESLMRIVC